ncbi:uncharacterized protein BXZ73DRAFT_107521 [Epithele typhae]|uniref:uncharacterized protein n=1 Tax=Epithele typhae TaxID=378194 RepID=UPI0020086A1A|nr:uncharacterized protein BXZ73DRAFT_107521 [Epithele typhae]KAH9912235.1 hypothetical protein BXZ73DRAFT_107521 [Epithele typhae]
MSHSGAFSGSSPMKKSVVKGAGNASIAGESGKENLEDHRGHVKAVKKLVPGLVMAVTSDRPDDLVVDPSRQKGDAGFFYPGCVPNDGKPRWADQIISVEFKQGLSGYDPFDDTPKFAAS